MFTTPIRSSSRSPARKASAVAAAQLREVSFSAPNMPRLIGLESLSEWHKTLPVYLTQT